jgi:large subunit ribosomal protein L22
MKAFLKNYRQSPRKVRLVANLVKGKPVDQALLELSYLPKRAANPLQKLLKSAVANAKKDGLGAEDLVVKNLTVDKGLVMRRIMPRARGSAAPILKRMSHVKLELSRK